MYFGSRQPKKALSDLFERSIVKEMYEERSAETTGWVP